MKNDVISQYINVISMDKLIADNTFRSPPWWNSSRLDDS